MDKKFKVTSNKTVLSQGLVDKFNEILALKTNYEKQTKDTEDQIIKLEQEVQKLDSDMLMEIDIRRSQGIQLKRKELREQVSDLKFVYKANLAKIIKMHYDKLLKEEAVFENANLEYVSYRNMIDAEIKRIKKESEEQINQLQNELSNHPYTLVNGLRNQIIRLTR